MVPARSAASTSRASSCRITPARKANIASSARITAMTAGLAALLLLLAMPTAHSQLTYYNITMLYPRGYSPSNVTVLYIPAVVNYTSLDMCRTPLPTLAYPAGGGTVLVFALPESLAPNATVTVQACQGVATVGSPFHHSTAVVLKTVCRSSLTSSSNSVLVDLSEGAYEETVFSYNVQAYLVNVTVSVEPVLVLGRGSYNVYVVTDSGWHYLGSSTSTQSFIYGPEHTRSLTIYVNVSGSPTYYYVVISWEVYWYPPVYNSTSVAITGGDVYYVMLSGRGSVSTGSLNATIDGPTSLLVTPLLVALNNTLLNAEPGSSVTVATSCYGANVTSVLTVFAYYANSTPVNLMSTSFGQLEARPRAAALINASISINTTAMATAIKSAAYNTVSLVILSASIVAAGYGVLAGREELVYLAPFLAFVSMLLAADPVLRIVIAAAAGAEVLIAVYLALTRTW